MAEVKTNKKVAKLKKRVVRFFQHYNNVHLVNETFEGIRIIMYETDATSTEEAYDKYKIHLMTSKNLNEKDVEEYIIRLYGGKILTEIVDVDGIEFDTITFN